MTHSTPYIVKVRKYDPYLPVLGRHVAIDSRSRRFPVSDPGPIQTVEHKRYIPILDQGNLGSCEGNALLGALGSGRNYALLFDLFTALGFPWAEATAVLFYSYATGIDPFPGQMPGQDTGTDNTSVANAGKHFGVLSGFENAYTTGEFLGGLMKYPGWVGVNWYNSFWVPNEEGIVRIASGALVDGGHAICCRRYDAQRDLIGFDQSWGRWGFQGNGEFWIPTSDVDRLFREDGEGTFPIPAAVAPPEPKPPVFDSPTREELQALANANQRWLNGHLGTGVARDSLRAFFNFYGIEWREKK